jgi:hypothetical protein
MADRGLQIRCRALLGFWVAAVIIVSLQAAAHHNNNFEIFRTSWLNLLAGNDLYVLNSRHRDLYLYSPSFALLFAPFAVLPFGVGLLLWNAVNATALYWGLGRVLSAEQAFAARLIVFMDTVGAMQNVQSNALVAGLMIITFAELERRHELRAALAMGCATAIKIFPILAAAFAIFRLFRLPRFILACVIVGALLLAAPLAVQSPAQLAAEYRSWVSISGTEAAHPSYSVMAQPAIWFGVDWPDWPIQLAGVVILLAPLMQVAHWGSSRFRLLFLASVLMFGVLFNHKAESPSFVIAVAGVAIWFVTSRRDRFAWIVLGIVIVGTVLSASDAMPELLQQRIFVPYKLKTLPVLLVWLLTQAELWRRNVSAPFDAPASPSAPTGERAE